MMSALKTTNLSIFTESKIKTITECQNRRKMCHFLGFFAKSKITFEAFEQLKSDQIVSSKISGKRGCAISDFNVPG